MVSVLGVVLTEKNRRVISGRGGVTAPNGLSPTDCFQLMLRKDPEP